MTTMLDGRYRLDEQIGRGGFSDVHRGWDEHLGRPVAIKWSREPDHRLHPAAMSIADVVHPRIVRVLDIGRSDARDWVVLDLVDGTNLTSLIDSNPDPADAFALIDAVLTGLDHLHRRGVVHGDISPGNVLLPAGQWEQAMLTDIGASVRVGDLLAVSPHYVAPEVAQGGSGSPASDLYAVGALLFHLLTGAPPFPGEDPNRVLAAHVTDPVPTPSTLASADEIIRTALAKNPSERYDFAEAMAAECRKIQSRPSLPVKRPVVPVQSNRTTELRTTRALPPVIVVPQQPDATRRSPAVIAWTTVGVIALSTTWAWANQRGTEPEVWPTLFASATATATPAPQPSVESVPDHRIVVPDVTGRTLTDATGLLESLGLSFVIGGEQDGPLESGRVVAAEPASGERVEPGSTVGLTIASGYQVVPDVAGLDRESARRVLATAGFPDVTDRLVTEPGGNVAIATAPVAGTRLPVGSMVWLVLPRVPTPTASPSPSPTVSITPEPSPNPSDEP